MGNLEPERCQVGRDPYLYSGLTYVFLEWKCLKFFFLLKSMSGLQVYKEKIDLEEHIAPKAPNHRCPSEG